LEVPLSERMVLDKCAEECVYNIDLPWPLSYSCSSAYGAELFLSALARLKHKRLLELLFSGTSSRTIETLFYALVPIKESTTLELLEKFSDLLCDNWNDAVTCQFSAFLIRCFARVAARRPKVFILERRCLLLLQSLLNSSRSSRCSRLFILTRAALSSLLSLLSRSMNRPLRMQRAFADLRQLWLGKNSSRVWEKLVLTCREETLQSLWEVAELAAHPCANFPLQKFMACVKSLELVRVSSSTPLIQKFLSSDRWGVAQALLRCAARHEELQEPLLKELRQYFRASKCFSPRRRSANHIPRGIRRDIRDKTLSMRPRFRILLRICNVSVHFQAKNRCGSHVLQSAFRSNTLSEDLKEKLIKAFEDDWGSLISDVYGSHVFESIWECSLFNVKRRQELMKKLVPIRSDSKFWKFAMLRCDMYLFRKDRKAWVEKMKKSVKGAKH
uniref:BTB/POZ domain-containing protein n=1 Tax=Heligmosomoides polygyrus TaxID=6339 RepID=A0A8L8JUM8_HELPZ